MVDAPLNAYQRVPPPSDPDSQQGHLDFELQKLERSVREIIARLGTLGTAYAPIASPVFTGDPQAPTPLTADNDTSIATTGYVQAQGYATTTALTTGLATKANTVHTHAQSDVTGLVTALASKADSSALASYALLASPALTGTPTAPTASSGDNSTKLATTAYADAAAPWKLVRKTSAQALTTSTLVDDTSLTFPMLANTTYAIRVMLSWVSTSGGLAIAANGPASPTLVQIDFNGTGAITTYNTRFVATTVLAPFVAPVNIMIQNGATAGNFVFRLSTGTASGTTTVQKGSYLEYTVIA